MAAALLTGLLAVFLLDVALGAPGTLAQEKENCPRDFHWERMSGQCCVQDFDTIPDHGRIGYTGNSICDDGYTGIYERRATTDGEGPPGCPNYTSFVFLEECVKKGSGAGGVTGGGGVIRDASEALYRSGGGPSDKDLAAAGAATAAAVAAAAAGSAMMGRLVSAAGAAGSRINGLTDRLADVDRQLEEAQRRLEEAREKRESAWRELKAMESAAEQVKRQLANLEAQIARCNRNVAWSNVGRAAFVISGICAAGAAALASLAAVPAAAAGGAALAGPMAALGAQIAKLEALIRYTFSAVLALGGITHGVISGAWNSLKSGLEVTRTNSALLRGAIDGQVKDLRKAYEAANGAVDEASTRVADLQSWRARVAEQLRLARGDH